MMGWSEATNAWSDEEIEVLAAGCAAGDSYSAIANRLPGRSRNACIGKAQRLGLDKARPEITRPSRAGQDCKPLLVRSGQGKMRKCLGCRDDFFSEHNGNRMCDRCRKTAREIEYVEQEPVPNFQIRST